MNDGTPGVLVELQQPVRMSSLRNCPTDRVGRKVVLGFSFDELVDFGILVPKVEATLAKVADSVVPLFALEAPQAEAILASVTLREPSVGLELVVAVQLAVMDVRSELDQNWSLGSSEGRVERLKSTLKAAKNLQRSLDQWTNGDLVTLEDVPSFDRQRFYDCRAGATQLVEALEAWKPSPPSRGRPSRRWEFEFVRQLARAFATASSKPARTWTDARPDYEGPFERFVSTVVDAAGLKTLIQTSLTHLIRSAVEPEVEKPSDKL